MKKIFGVLLFIILITNCIYAAKPADPGVVQEILDVNFTNKVHFNETFSIRARLIDENALALVGQACSLDIIDISTTEDRGTALLKHIETKEKCIPGIEDCYHVSDSGGVIWISDDIDWEYLPGHSYQAQLRCDTNTSIVTFNVLNSRELTSRSYSFINWGVDNAHLIGMGIVIVIAAAVTFALLKGGN